MNCYIKNGVGLVLGVALLAVLAPRDASAQLSVGAFVAIAEDFPDVDARALVVREGGREVIVLRADEATPEALAMSIVVLERARERAPTPENGEMIPITGFVFPSGLGAERRARLEAVLARLAARPSARIEPFGPGRWLPLEAVR